MRLTASRCTRFGLPGGHRLVREPDRETSPLAQGGIVFGPACDPVPLLGDAVTAISIGLERHGRNPRSGGHSLPMPSRSGHQPAHSCNTADVAFSFADAKQCLEQAGTPLTYAGMIGGGSRSVFWARIFASVLNVPMLRYQGSDKGPAFGAARLARLAATGEAPEAVCTAPSIIETIEPEPQLVELYGPRI